VTRAFPTAAIGANYAGTLAPNRGTDGELRAKIG
jgi:hypothetical protein